MRHSGVNVTGKAHDLGCSKRVARVTVALAKRTGNGRCRYLRAGGALGKAVSCRRPTYIQAKGTKTWTFRSASKLPAGTYVVRSRAIDAAGNLERKQRRRGRLRNFVTVKLR